MCIIYFSAGLTLQSFPLILTFLCRKHLFLRLTSSSSPTLLPADPTWAFNFALLSLLLPRFSSRHLYSPLIAHFSLPDCTRFLLFPSPAPRPATLHSTGVKIQCHSYIISYNCLGDYSAMCHKTLFSRKQKATAGEGDRAWLIVV